MNLSAKSVTPLGLELGPPLRFSGLKPVPEALSQQSYTRSVVVTFLGYSPI